MSKTFKQFLFLALFGVVALGTFGSFATAHAWSGSSSSCAVGTGMYVTNLSDATPQVGETVSYELEATYSFTASTTITVTDVVPAGLTFVSSTASTGTFSSSTGTWNVGTLNNGSFVTLIVTATVNPGTEGQRIKIKPEVDYVQSACTQSSAVVGATLTVQGSASCSLSAAQFEAAVASGTISWNPISTNTNTASFSITNDTACSAPISLASYEVFESSTSPHFLSTQQLFDTTSTTLAASSTQTLVVSLPACSAQTDAYYGSAPTNLLDSNPYSYPNVPFVLVYAFTNSGQLCGAPPVADLSITKTVDNTSPSAGSIINYTLTVDAMGPATSTGVVATDTWPSGLTFENATTSAGTSYASSTGTWTIGDMSPSSTATLNIAALVDASDTVGQTITNFATVGETPSSTNQTGNSSSSVTVTVAGGGCSGSCGGGNDAALSIAKTVNVSSTLPGDMIDYTITATAGGPNPSTGVVATDTWPSGLTFENATTSAGTSYASSTGTWTIGTLAPNATATLEIAALVNASGTENTTITNQATIGESATLTNTSASTTAQVAVSVGTPTSMNEADLSITKTVDNTSPVTGTDVNFTIVVANNGPDVAPDVVAEDQMPIGLATILATTTPSTTYNMGTGEWDIGTLAVNATATLAIEAEVSAAGGTQVTNTATVSSTLASLIDPNPANNSSSVTLNVQSAGCTSNCGGGGGGGGGNVPTAQLAIVKTVDNSDPATGGVVHYTLTVSAEGPSASFGVVASDKLPSGVTFDSASSSEGSYNSSTGIWTIGYMANGTSATLVITATVTAPNSTTITNTGTVSESPTVQSPLTGPMTSSVTIDVGGQVLGASTSTVATSTGQVLGASCGLYLTSYIHPYRQDLNDPAQVEKLQTFLNQNLGLNLPVNGIYGDSTIAAVDQFQVKYHTEVLSPWVPLGLPTQYTPTGYVYQSTQRWINLIMCPALNLPLPQLKVDTGE